jgi:uncharacterized protein YecE (DUF72 family)
VQPVNTEQLAPAYYLGLPMWSNRDWVGSLFPAAATSKTFLKHYSSVFNTVEGNTTFYALPAEKVVASWCEQAQAGFRFCFKFPREITHHNSLRHSDAGMKDFFERVQPLTPYLGSFMIQLPASFAPGNLDELGRFLKKLPEDFRYSVEVRHEGFFQRDDNERELNRLLHRHQVDRICFDSRALFSLPPGTAEEIDAHRKKPQLPVHALATASEPIVRFIGSSNMAHNKQYFMPWVKKLNEWVAQGLQPSVFIHTPDNHQAPVQASEFHQLLQGLDGWQPLPDLASSTQTSFL